MARAALALACFALGCAGQSAAGAESAAVAAPSGARPAFTVPAASSAAGSASSTAPAPTFSAAVAGGSAPSASAAVDLPPPVVPDDMRAVPGGTFVMGADEGGERDERPAHRVTVKTFWLDLLETTNAEWLSCVAADRCRPYRPDTAQSMHLEPESRFRGPKQPVVGVSWDDAVGYCTWKGKRLPTETEWERAASGDDRRRYVWGNEKPDKKKHGCFSGCKLGQTMDVGSYPEGAGPYGHLDLAGNVWEWLSDYYDPYAYQRPTASDGVPGTCDEIKLAQEQLRRSNQQGYTGTNPIPVECERVLRGGAFNYAPQGLRVTNRVHHPGSWRLLVAGFRCARDPG